MSSSSHLAPVPYSTWVNPVAFPAGRARLATNPAATGSGVCVNTTGTVRVTCNSGPTTEPPEASMTSGASPTSSAAYIRMSSALPAVQRSSIRTLRPTAQPNSCSPCRNAARRVSPSGSPARVLMSTPILRMRSACCARARSGQETKGAAAPPMRAMTSRRRMRYFTPAPLRPRQPPASPNTRDRRGL